MSFVPAPSPQPQVPSPNDRLRQRERPAGRPVMHQTWRDLLFLHWRVEPERIQRTLPPGLFVDTHDGAAWIGVVPFFMHDIRPRWFPWVPGFSAFLELNVRTYVHDAAGAPGIWFYSLDCNQPLAVWGARMLYHLPYRHARMTATKAPDGTIVYASHVKQTASFCEATYRLDTQERVAEPGTLEFFLLERYTLFAANRSGRLFTGRVHHRPYPLVAATLTAQSTNLLMSTKRISSAQQREAGKPWLPLGATGAFFAQTSIISTHDWGVDRSQPDHVCGSPGFVDVEVFGLQVN